jgi:hypothetical protein
MRDIIKYLSQLGWDKRVTAVVMYTLVPALVGTVTRLAEVNPMLGDFFEVDLKNGIATAFAILVLYVCLCILFFLFVSRIGSHRQQAYEAPDARVGALGIFVLLYQLASLVFTLQYGFGVAASSDSVDSNLKIIFILLSSDYIFFVFFLLARNSPWLVGLNSVTYVGYSILRGWASGVLLLLVLLYIKSPYRIKWRQVFIGLGLLFALAPLLLGVREFFRGAESESSDLGMLLSTVIENIHYDDIVFFLVNRFDLVPPTQAFAAYYKTLEVGLHVGNVCYAWNEGIYQTIFNAVAGNAKCVAAGEALPSLIHGQFFFDRRTAFSVGAGWLYGADFLITVCFSLYIFLLLSFSRLLAGPLVRLPVIRALFVFLIVFYLVPGWYFHFIQGVNAVFFANMFLRLTWVRRRSLSENVAVGQNTRAL